MKADRLVPLVLVAFFAAACGGTDTPQASTAAEVSSVSVLSASCSGCHLDGGAALVSLDGRTAGQLKDALLLYRNDDAGTTVMHRLARGYSEAEISEIAAYLGADSS
ncbi:MAG: hypothetical protein AAF768_11220 [Pseudomonadota bacterium]